jgi:hypothetical protein
MQLHIPVYHHSKEQFTSNHKTLHFIMSRLALVIGGSGALGGRLLKSLNTEKWVCFLSLLLFLDPVFRKW